MKHRKIKFLISIVLCGTSWHTQTDQLIPQFTIVVPSYNNSQWYQKNLYSIFSQTYPHYRVIYIDDQSPDKTGILVQKYLEKHNVIDKVNLIINTNRKGALANLYYGIHSCQDHEIVVTLDGDDWFAHEHVLETLANVYSNPNVWLTYGQYTHPWGGIGCAREINQKVIEHNSYRENPSVASHLRTFYAWLFKMIKFEDLLYKGTFFPMTWDWAMMYPMLEMSGGKFRFISEVLYVYNTDNPINDIKVDSTFQEYLGSLIQQKKPYQPLEKPISFSQHLAAPFTCSVVIINDDTPSSLKPILQTLHNQLNQYRLYVIHKKSPQLSKNYKKLIRHYSDVLFVEYKNNVNTALKKVFIKEQYAKTNFCVVTPSNHALAVCKELQHAIKILKQTKATVCSLITRGKNKNTTRHNITDTHYTPLYDTVFTYQLGWEPRIPIAAYHGHVFALDCLEMDYRKLPKLIMNTWKLNPQFKNTFPEHAGLLMFQS